MGVTLTVFRMSCDREEFHSTHESQAVSKELSNCRRNKLDNL